MTVRPGHMGKHQFVLCIMRLRLRFLHLKVGVCPQEYTFPNAIKFLPRRLSFSPDGYLLINLLRIQRQVVAYSSEPVA